MKIEQGLKKLNLLLPLRERKNALSKVCRKTHSDILRHFSDSACVHNDYDENHLDMLALQDLIIFDKENKKISGAYPFSLNKTPHQVFFNNKNIYAMCAFDAIAIAPVFNLKTKIISRCFLTDEEIIIEQNGEVTEKIMPSNDIFIGIRWQSAGVCAAESLCMEMIFLSGNEIAEQWQNKDEYKAIYCFNDAVEFATAYFKPLIAE